MICSSSVDYSYGWKLTEAVQSQSICHLGNYNHPDSKSTVICWYLYLIDRAYHCSNSSRIVIILTILSLVTDCHCSFFFFKSLFDRYSFDTGACHLHCPCRWPSSPPLILGTLSGMTVGSILSMVLFPWPIRSAF